MNRDVTDLLESVLWHGLVESLPGLQASESVGLWLMDGTMLQPLQGLRLRHATPFRADEGAVGQCFRTGQVLHCGDVAARPGSDELTSLCAANEARSFLLFPMSIGRIKIGVLGLFGKTVDPDISARASSLGPYVAELALYLVLCEAVLSRYGPAALERAKRELGRPGYPSLVPKGIQVGTLSRVYDYMLSLSEPEDAESVASHLGLSSVTTRKYLEHLTQADLLDATVHYGGPGRPLKRYMVPSAKARGGAGPGGAKDAVTDPASRP